MFEIFKKVEKNLPDCMIFKYIIKFDDTRPRPLGECYIFLQRFKTLKNGGSPIRHNQVVRWHKMGLAKEDFFACLDDFYPNSRNFAEREKYLRKGNGTAVLAAILDDVKHYAPKLIYAIPTNMVMKEFLLANNWRSDYRNMAVMYKLL